MRGIRVRIAAGLTGFLLLGAWVLVSKPAGAADGLPSERTTFRAVATANFRVMGNISPRKVVEIAERLEIFRAALGRIRSQGPLSTSEQTVVLAFPNERELRPYLYVDGQPAQGYSGVFVPSEWANYLVFDASAGEDPLDSIYAGYIHFFVGDHLPDAPLWLKKGLAEYYQTFRATATTVEVGRMHKDHLRRLSRGWRIPLARLVELDRDSPEYRDPEQFGIFSAQCWALVHYLLLGTGESAVRVPELFQRLERNEGLEPALQATLGIGAGELESRLKYYVEKPILSYQIWKTGELAIPEIGAAVEPGRGEVLALLGEYLAHSEVDEPARVHLEGALAAEPGNGDAQALLAHVAERGGRLDEARALYAKALAGTLRRPTSALHAARFALDRAEQAGYASAKGKAELAAARAAATKAREIEPESGEAFAIEGRALLESNEAVAALVALSEAQTRLPNRTDVVWDRFRAAIDAGHPAIARGLANGSMKRLDPKLAARALHELAQREQYELPDRVGREIESATREKRYDDALAAARAGLAKATEPRVVEFLTKRLADLERWVTEQKRVEAYNRAGSLGTGGQYAEAVAVLDELLADCPDTEPLCRAARTMREQLTAQLKRKR